MERSRRVSGRKGGDLPAPAHEGGRRGNGSEGSPGARILIVLSPLDGHVNPTIAVGEELSRRGHTVAWTGHTGPVAPLLPAWATFLPLSYDIPPEVRERTLRGRRGLAGIMATWEAYVLPVANQMVPLLHDVIDAFTPDVLIVDQQAIAGAAVAEVRGLRWATSATTPIDLVNLLGDGKLGVWIDGLLQDFMVESGVPRERAVQLDPRRSPHLLLAYTTRALFGADVQLPDHYALIGPSLGDRGHQPSFPWDWLERAPAPRVMVSLGTINWRWGEQFFQVAAEAFADMDVRAVFVVPPDVMPDPPANVLVRERVPQLALLPHLDAVVSHGGNNTVCESLTQGLPLVCSPLHDDQPMIADQVVQAGAGLRVKFFRLTASMLREAVEAVLTDPSYRAGAERVRQSFVAAGGAAEGASRIEALLARAPARMS